jgi:protein involved in polysaccharide export with SLBB domain
MKWLKFILVVLMYLVSTTINAQTWLGKDLSNINVKELTASQREEVLRTAKRQGLNEADLEAMARAKGLNVDDLKRAQIAENAGKSNAVDTAKEKKKVVSENVLQTTVAIYGQELFENNTMGFAPSLNLAPTAAYILGPNDKLAIRIFGLQEQSMNVVIANNGSVVIPYGGKVMLSGLTLTEAERILSNQLKKYGFASLGSGESHLKIQITEFRTIQVMVWGGKQSGAYYLPSLATAFHALFAAGGPGLNRSYRNIHVIRNGKTIRVIDLYEFLSRGSRASDITLQDNDIIFIPYYDRRVRLRGEVKTPAVYELLATENLQSALMYAGGYTEIAYKDVIEVLRYGGKEKEVFSVRFGELAQFSLLGSEIVTISSIADRFKNRVKVDGAVERPGYYSMAAGIDLKQAIENAGGLKLNAIRSYVLLSRDPRDGGREYLAFSLDSVMRGDISVALQENDLILVGDSLEMNRKDQIFVFGDVNHPGGFNFGAGLTVTKLLFLAGGFEQEALTNKVIISRKVEDESQLASVIELGARRDFWNDAELNNYKLQPGDVVTVSRNPYYRDQVYVSCEGEFKVPGIYPMSTRKQTLFDIYTQAGGSTLYGSVEGSILIRQHRIQISGEASKKLKIKLLNEMYEDDTLKVKKNRDFTDDRLRFDTIVIGGGNRKFSVTAKSFYLQPGDRFVIPTIESTVRIVGEVYNPNVIMYDEKLNLKNYLEMSGGTTEAARVSSVFIIYQNGRSSKTRHLLGVFKIHPRIKPGCEIIVPSKNSQLDRRVVLSTQERITLYSVMTSTMSSLGFIMVQLLKK